MSSRVELTDEQWRWCETMYATWQRASATERKIMTASFDDNQMLILLAYKELMEISEIYASIPALDINDDDNDD